MTYFSDQKYTVVDATNFIYPIVITPDYNQAVGYVITSLLWYQNPPCPETNCRLTDGAE